MVAALGPRKRPQPALVPIMRAFILSIAVPVMWWAVPVLPKARLKPPTAAAAGPMLVPVRSRLMTCSVAVPALAGWLVIADGCVRPRMEVRLGPYRRAAPRIHSMRFTLLATMWAGLLALVVRREPPIMVDPTGPIKVLVLPRISMIWK